MPPRTKMLRDRTIGGKEPLGLTRRLKPLHALLALPSRLREAHSLASTPPDRGMPSAGARVEEVGNDASPPQHAARSRLIIGKSGPSDSALAAASGGRLRRPAADRHAARCASRDLCSGVRPSAPYALGGAAVGSDVVLRGVGA